MGLLDRFTKPKDPSAPSDQEATVESPPAVGLMARLRQGLRRTSQVLQTDIRDLFKHDGQLVDEQFLDRLYTMLVRTDMGAGPASTIRDEIHGAFRGRVVHMDDVLARVRENLVELLEQEEAPLNLQAEGPTVIIMVGVNGSGKTTSIAKLTRMVMDQGRRVVLGAGDTFRAAAVEQLAEWARRLKTELVVGTPGSDPASVAHRALARTLETGADVCIIDTAGRLQTQAHLMDQLTKLRRVIQKLVPSAPHDVLLVLDATAGQNGISQARGFSEAIQCTGILLSKLDGSAKGGVVIPIRQQFRIPVKYVGVGERPEDLAPFRARDFVEALLSDG
jgi:fused signal recognition particle receptor